MMCATDQPKEGIDGSYLGPGCLEWQGEKTEKMRLPSTAESYSYKKVRKYDTYQSYYCNFTGCDI